MFYHFHFFQKKKFKLNKAKNMYIGDIAICYEIINASFEKKLIFFLKFDKAWVHGLFALGWLQPY